jgi:hypothetical protein
MPHKDIRDRKAYHRAYSIAWSKRNATRKRNSFYKSRYGITIEDYDRILISQDGRCAICLRPPLPDRRLDVDHDHESGVVRGLLCPQCNRGLGHLGDVAPANLRRAADYIERSLADKFKAAP